MLPRTPKTPPFFKKILGGIIILEALAFGASYFTWRKLNTSREFRQDLSQSAPWALEMYYKIGEMASDSNKVIRQTDEAIWAYNATKKDNSATKNN